MLLSSAQLERNLLTKDFYFSDVMAQSFKRLATHLTRLRMCYVFDFNLHTPS
jgi:hypothetical protein